MNVFKILLIICATLASSVGRAEACDCDCQNICFAVNTRNYVFANQVLVLVSTKPLQKAFGNH
ncbi:MAG: hypothetical protein S4CHLAM81_04480 [Chlamydiales bacterium]|nr:hypothetical protein [Chlamydiales bacterium]MCH9635237.1 hypothetical protein [Chlamydiales bacterium]